jgi:hypothetical protein
MIGSSADESAELEQEAHCHDRTAARDYRPPRDRERESLDICRFCFPDGIECDEAEIIVVQSRKSDAKLHRVEGSEETLWRPSNDQDCNVTRTLQREDVTTWDELAEALEEGGG